MLRRLRIPALVVGGLLLVYTLVGFFVVPPVARDQAIDLLGERYGLDLSIEKIRFNPFTLVAEIERLDLGDGEGARLVAFQRLHADVEWRSIIDRAVVLRAIELERPFVHVHLRPDGSLNLAEAFRDDAPPAPPAEDEPSDPPVIEIGRFLLSGGEVRVTDESEGRSFDERLTPLDLDLEQFTTRREEGAELTRLTVRLASGGQIEVHGDLSAIPASFDLALRGEELPLPIAQPYVPETLAARIADGRLYFDFALRHGQPGQATLLAVTGGAEVRDLAVTPEGDDEPVLAWESVALGGLALDLEPGRLHIDEIGIRGLNTGFHIHADGDTNIARVLRTAAAEDGEAEGGGEKGTDAAGESGNGNGNGGGTGTDDSPPATDFPFTVGRVVVQDAKLDFRDEQIRPSVHVLIHELGGEVTGIDSAPDSRVSASLRGVVGEHGSADIDAAVAPFAPETDLDATVAFGNVELTDFSPYAGRFAGYEISKGKLFLDLKYTLVESRIKGENHALFDQFELGDRVESEDATSLPVKFALSLLRDRHGKIDLRLPVEGDINEPGFRFMHLIGQALLNVLTKIVTSPFSFLAETFGGGPDMEYASFEAGSAMLADAEREKFAPLATALAERPRLVVEIRGEADPDADRAALTQRRLDELMATAESPEAAYDGQFGEGAAARLREELAEAAAQAVGAADVGAEDAGAEGADTEDAVREGAESDDAAAPDPEAVFQQALLERLREALRASDEDLFALAGDRARQVMNVLVREGGADAARIFVRQGGLGAAGEGTRARLTLDAR